MSIVLKGTAGNGDERIAMLAVVPEGHPEEAGIFIEHLSRSAVSLLQSRMNHTSMSQSSDKAEHGQDVFGLKQYES